MFCSSLLTLCSKVTNNRENETIMAKDFLWQLSQGEEKIGRCLNQDNSQNYLGFEFVISTCIKQYCYVNSPLWSWTLEGRRCLTHRKEWTTYFLKEMHFSLDPSRIRFHFAQNIHANVRMDGLWRHLLFPSSEAAQKLVDLKWVAQMIHHPYKFGSKIRLKLIIIHFSRLFDQGKALILLNNCHPFYKNNF